MRSSRLVGRVRELSRKPYFMPLAVGTLGAVAVRLLLGPALVTYDTAYALAWGGGLARGELPDYDVVLPPTPHPLMTLEGLVLAPLGGEATDVAAWLGLAALGALGALAFAAGRLLAGWFAGLVAVGLVLTREPLLYWGSLTYLDIPYAALVLGAAVAVIRRPERLTLPMVCLVLAGLLRPEAWALGFALVAYAWWRERRLPLGVALLAVVAPAAWVLGDLITTGDPFYSFTFTQEVTEGQDRDVSLGELAARLPREIGRIVQVGVVLGALIGLVVLWRRRSRDGLLLAGMGAGVTGLTAAVTVAGTPLNQRYLFVGAVVLCVLCALAIDGLRSSDRLLRAGGVVAAVAVAISAAAQVDRLRFSREALQSERTILAELERSASREGASCRRLVAPSRVAPWLSVWRGRSPGTFIARRPQRRLRATVLAPTGDPAVREFVGRNPDRWELEPTTPAPEAGLRYWRVEVDCSARPGR